MDNLTINLNLYINDVINEWPETIRVFVYHKMNCVGCDMNAFETIRDALTIYNISPNQFLDEINVVLRNRCSDIDAENK
jgi:hybrid cluster-associated redox disulfide protein